MVDTNINIIIIDVVDRANKVLLEALLTSAKVTSDPEKAKYVERNVALELFEFLKMLLKKLNAKEMYCENLSLYPHTIVIGDSILSLRRNWLDLIEISLDNVADVIEKWECKEKN
jgi:hypothetical protein